MKRLIILFLLFPWLLFAQETGLDGKTFGQRSSTWFNNLPEPSTVTGGFALNARIYLQSWLDQGIYDSHVEDAIYQEIGGQWLRGIRTSRPLLIWALRKYGNQGNNLIPDNVETDIKNKFNQDIDNGYLFGNLNDNKKVQVMAAIYTYCLWYGDRTVPRWGYGNNVPVPPPAYYQGQWPSFSINGHTYTFGQGPITSAKTMALDYVEWVMNRWYLSSSGGSREFDSNEYARAFPHAMAYLYTILPASNPLRQKAKMALHLSLYDSIMDIGNTHAWGGTMGRADYSPAVTRNPVWPNYTLFGDMIQNKRSCITAFYVYGRYVSHSDLIPDLIVDLGNLNDENNSYWHFHKEYNSHGLLNSTGYGKWTFVTKNYSVGSNVGQGNNGWQVVVKDASNPRGFARIFINRDSSEPPSTRETNWLGYQGHQFKSSIFDDSINQPYIWIKLAGGFTWDTETTSGGWTFKKEGVVMVAYRLDSNSAGIEVATQGVEYGNWAAFTGATRTLTQNYFTNGLGNRIDDDDECGLSSPGDCVFPFHRMETIKNGGSMIINWNNNVMAVNYGGRSATYDFSNWTIDEPPPPPPPTVPPYYVDFGSGSDSNNGSSATPFKNIQKAADVVDPGDTVYVRNGTYTDQDADDIVVDLNRGGTSGNWIVFKAVNKWGANLDGENNSTTYLWNFGANASYIRIEDFELYGGVNGFWNNNGADNVYIYGNSIHDLGRQCTDTAFGQGLPVFQGIGASNHTYDSNVIYTNGRFADGEQGCDPATTYWQNHDHGLYLNESNGTLVINNIFYDNLHGWNIDLTYTSATYSNIKIINNTFADPNPNRVGHIIIEGDAEDILIQNNIFYNPNTHAIRLYPPPALDAIDGKINIDVWYNLVYGIANLDSMVQYEPYHTAEFTVQNNILDNPDFVNASGRNYGLLSSSPAIDAGLAANAPTYDIDGNTRPSNGVFEIGAYESDVIAPPENSFYVNKTTGNDNNNGSIGAPWENISKVNSTTLAVGTTVHFNRGDTWIETLTVPSSGTLSDPITFTAYGTGNKPKMTRVRDNGAPRIYIELDNLNVNGYSDPSYSGAVDFRAGSSHHITIQNCLIDGFGAGQLAIYIKSDYTTIKNNTIIGQGITNGGVGIEMNVDRTSDNNWIEDNEISYMQEGMMLTGNNHTITGNEIHHNGRNAINVPSAITDTLLYTSNNTITYNNFHHNGIDTQNWGDATNMNATWLRINNSMIAYNLFYSNGVVGLHLDDGCVDNTIYNNVFYDHPDNIDAIEGWTLVSGNVYYKSMYIEPRVVTDNGLKNMVVEDDGQKASVGLDEWDWESDTLWINIGENPNTAAGDITRGQHWGGGINLEDGIHGDYATHDNIIKNNIGFWNDQHFAMTDMTDHPDANNTTNYNFWTENPDGIIGWLGSKSYGAITLVNWQDSTGQGANSVTGNPNFVNAPNGDFRAASYSPAVDAGTDVGFNEDYDGNIVPSGTGVDMGAFEYLGGEGGFPPARRRLIGAVFEYPDIITLEWDKDPIEPDLAGFKIYTGLLSRNYVDTLDTGLIERNSHYKYSFSVDFSADSIYYFAVTAYDSASNESEFSNEVFVVTQQDSLLPPYEIDIEILSGNFIATWKSTTTGIDQFRVYWSDVPNHWRWRKTIDIEDVGSSGEFYMKVITPSPELIQGITYYFTMASLRQGEISNYSEEIVVRIFEDEEPPVLDQWEIWTPLQTVVGDSGSIQIIIRKKKE